MKTNIASGKYILAGSLAVLATVIASSYAYAGSVDGKGGVGTISSGGGGGGGGTCSSPTDSFDIYCAGWSWVYYKYTAGNSSPYYKQQFTYTPRYKSFGVNSYVDGSEIDRVVIADECAQEGSGFWHLGRNMRSNDFPGQNSYGDPSGTSVTLGETTFRNVISVLNVGERDCNWNIITNPYDVNSCPELNRTGHRETYNYSTLSNIYSKQATSDFYAYEHGADDSFSGYELSDILTANDHPVYEATKYGSHEQVELDYYNQVLHGEDGTSASNYAELTEAEKQEIRDNIATTIYFCAFEDGGKKDEYTGEVELKINWSDGQLGSKVDATITNDGSQEKVDDKEVHKVSNPSIVYNAYGKSTSVNNVQTKTKYKVTARPSGKTTGDIDSNGFFNSPSEVSTLNMIPGVKYEICAENTYNTAWASAGGYSGERTISACTHVVYEMPCDDFGTTITADNRKNYARIEVTTSTNANASAKAGDMSDGSYQESATNWHMSGAPAHIEYFGCMGGQTVNDENAQKAGKGRNESGTTVYLVGSNLGKTLDNGFSSLYYGANNYVDAPNSAEGQNISSAEPIPDDYQFDYVNTTTNTVYPRAGSIYTSNYVWPRTNGAATNTGATVYTKVPYNYMLKPSLTEVTKANLTIGSSYRFKAEYQKLGRVNAQLRTTNDSASNATEIKGITKAIGVMFKIPADVTLDGVGGLQAALSPANGVNQTAQGDYYYVGGESDNPMGKISSLGYEEIASYDLINNPMTDVVTKEIDNGVEVGTKVCALAAVWPADSHNDINPDINSEDQSNALTSEAGTNPIWRFDVSCSTVGKQPIMSVEGASLTTSGNVDASVKDYKGRLFGTWAEYDLIAKKVNNPTGSGAALAYATPIYSYTADVDEQKKLTVDPSQAGLEKTSSAIVNPQTLGNYVGNGSTADAATYLNMSALFAGNIKGTFYSGDTVTTPSRVVGDVDTIEGKSGILFYTDHNNGTISINHNITNNTSDAVLVVYGKNIEIAPDVERIDAILIADGYIDTCAGYSRDDKTGNQSLKEHCYKQLVVNGAVYAGGQDVADDREVLRLDRTFGGGNIEGGNLDANTLSQRAEIFNYDPRIIKLSYEYMREYDPLAESYTEELSTRY